MRSLLGLAAGASCLLVTACSETQTEETIAEPITATAAAESGAEESGAEESGAEESAEDTAPEEPAEASTTESSGSQRTLPLPVKSEPQCTEESLQESFPNEGKIVFTSQGCIGDFAKIGPPGTDFLELVRWTGEKWELVPGDGMVETHMSRQRCWTEESIEKLGIPEEFDPYICGIDYRQGL